VRCVKLTCQMAQTRYPVMYEFPIESLGMRQSSRRSCSRSLSLLPSRLCVPPIPTSVSRCYRDMSLLMLASMRLRINCFCQHVITYCCISSVIFRSEFMWVWNWSGVVYTSGAGRDREQAPHSFECCRRRQISACC